MVRASKLLRCSRPLSLPDEVVFDEILVRIPLLSLVRFRSVSKCWCSTLSSPKFMAAYHKRRGQIQAGAVLELYMNHSQIHHYNYNNIIDDQMIFFNQTTQLDLPTMLVSTETYINHNYNSIRRWSRMKKMKKVVRVYKVVGYCDGIMCFLLPSPGTNHDPYTEQILVWDLTLGKTTLSLPSSYDYFTYGTNNHDDDIIFGMGYDDKSSQDYKVIRASFFPGENRETVVVKANVYSLRSNTWRSFEATLPWADKCITHRRDGGVHLNGALYWLEGGYSGLLTFCLANEVFDHIPMTEPHQHHPYRIVHVSLINLDMGGQHKLGLFTQGKHNATSVTVALSVMLDSSKCWTKLYDIDLGTRLRSIKIINHQFLLAKSADDDGGQWFVYDFRTCKKVSVIIKDEEHEVNDPCLYRSSLF